MSFLAPLYVLGALAVSLPVLFHLIRRSPRGRVVFSSLMFLKPSPPRITRRSRLDNWLLLLLRAAAICILALAFARPFLREAVSLSASQAGRRIAILVDTSASMRRGDVWERVGEAVRERLDDATPADRVALFAFDDRVQTIVDFDNGAETPPQQRRALLTQRLAELRPTWGGTNLGAALVTLADALDATVEPSSADSETPEGGVARTPRALQVVVVTDLQRGSRLDALDAYSWPPHVRLAVERVAPTRTDNASLELLGGTESSEEGTRYRVRVANEAASSLEEFALEWRREGARQPGGDETTVVVPPGESRVVSLLAGTAEAPASQLVLSGDSDDFDNVIHLAPRAPEQLAVVWMGDEAPGDAQDVRYYLERALVGDDVRVDSLAPEAPLLVEGERPPRLVVVTAELGDEAASRVRRYVEEGGTVLCVLKDADATGAIASLLELADPSAVEVSAREYAMLGEIDFSHPVFAAFADPRFSDFTKIRFWRHRRLAWDAAERADLRVVARFDDGDPAVVERTLGEGRVVVLTSGWHPRDSQLALSTKFVPLLASVLGLSTGEAAGRMSYRVNDAVPVPAAKQPDARRVVRAPGDAEHVLAATDERFTATSEPGIYELDTGGERRRFAVNLAPGEGRTSPLGVSDLEQRGIRLGVQDETSERERQMLDVELESSQKLWRWAIVGALALLVLETWIAGRLARRAAITGERV